jgi:hypothetical protein
MPSGLTLEEVSEIMTRVQSDDELPNDGSFPRRIDHHHPIQHLTRDGDNVEVWTGFQKGPLNGRGEVIRFKKENGKWVIKSIGMWVS